MRWLTSAVLAVVLASCSTGDAIDVRFDAPRGAVVFRAEVADEPDEMARGLQGRRSLGARAGMLFVWSDVAPRSFWMKDTLIPLDLVVIRAGRVVEIHTMHPCSADPCRLTETAPADAALEIRAGEAAAVGIVPGTLVDAEPLA